MRNPIILFSLLVAVLSSGCTAQLAEPEVTLLTADDLADGQRPVVDLREGHRTVIDGTVAPVDLTRVDLEMRAELVPLADWLIDEAGYTPARVAALGGERFVLWPAGAPETVDGVGGRSEATRNCPNTDCRIRFCTCSDDSCCFDATLIIIDATGDDDD